MRSIVYVNVLGGPPFEHVIARLNRLGEVHVVQPEAMSAAEEAQLRSLVQDVRFISPHAPGNLESVLVELVREIGANVLLTFDEFSLRDVSAAAVATGLRGPGVQAWRSVNKQQIYSVLGGFDLLKRPYHASVDFESIIGAPIAAPYVIKPAECAGSLGVLAVREDLDPNSLRALLKGARNSVDRVIDTLWSSCLQGQSFIREGMLIGDAPGWFGSGAGYADYISVEGMILNSRYHPLGITQNHPLIDPFIETVSMTPCTLPLSAQRAIVDRITPCLESIGLENCGTHTEIKLLPDGEIAIIETAARFAGWSIIPQIEAVFGIDPITTLVNHLIDPSTGFDLTFEEIFERRRGCAATINLLPVDEVGQPWGDDVVFRQEPQFAGVIDPTSRGTFTPYVSIGEPLKRFDSYDGAWNSFGKVFLEARDLETLNSDILAIRRRLRELIQ